MSLLLAVESSSNVYRIVIGRGRETIFDSAVDNCESSIRTLGSLLSCGLDVAGASAGDIKGIAINIGPGSLTFVRAGISFVNALAFSLNIQIHAYNWFEIVAAQANGTTALPIVCAVPAANDNAYVGLIRGGTVEIMRFGPLDEALAKVSGGLTGEVAVAGRISHRLATLLGERRVVDIGIDTPDAGVLLRMLHDATRNDGNTIQQVEALNDQSPLFFD